MPPDPVNSKERSQRWAAHIHRWYHLPVLGLLMLYMLWVRLLPYDTLVHDDAVYFLGNDPYYHFRETNFVIENWPYTMPFDPWSNFPYGTYVGQFGTLFDQVIATIALIIGLGNPTEQQIAIVFVLFPAILGVLCAIPTYLLGKRLSGRAGGLFAVLILALLPGMFLSRSVAGFTDHHVAEVLLKALAIWVLMVALTIAERQKPIYEQFLERDWRTLREPIMWSVFAGIVITLYLWTWPPGIVLVGILGVFFTIALCIEFIQGRSPEHIAIVGAICLGIVGVLSLLTVDAFTIESPTVHNLLHPLLAFAVAIGCVFLAWLARTWEHRRLSTQSYPIAVGSLIGIGILFVYFAVPDVFNTIWSNVLRTIALGQTDTALTIGEAQSTFTQPAGASSYLFNSYGFTHLTALIALGWLTARLVVRDAYRTERVLIVVWAVFTLMMALTQIRFHYYFAVVVAVLNAWLLGQILNWINLPSIPEVSRDTVNIGSYRVLTIALILIIIVVPLAAPIGPLTVVEQANQQSPGSVVVWQEGAEWLSEETPPPGTFGPADEPMEYYGIFDRTDDFVYPEGAYGVMSWWDYGHWITVIGERIPHANPFQQGATSSSAYFQAQDEDRANLLLDALPSTSSPHGYSDEELTTMIAEQPPEESNERIRYVMIDDEMAAEKFPAIATWSGPGMNAYVSFEQFNINGINESLPVISDQYQATMLSRLYYDDAQGMSHYRLVHETDQYSIVGGHIDTRGDGQVRAFSSLRIPGGWLDQAAGFSEQLDAARQEGRAVSIGAGQYVYNSHVLASVKTFERVDGATIHGEANTSEEITAFLELEVTHTGRTFFYIQTVDPDTDGTFELVVPYATEEYLGVEDGYTNSSVRATGNYTVFSGSLFAPDELGYADVPDRAVVDGDTIQIELESVDEPELPPNGVENNETVTNDTVTNGENDLTDNETTDSGPDENENELNESARITALLSTTARYGTIITEDLVWRNP